MKKIVTSHATCPFVRYSSGWASGNTYVLCDLAAENLDLAQGGSPPILDANEAPPSWCPLRQAPVIVTLPEA